MMIKLFKKKLVQLEISPLGGILHLEECQNDFNYKEFLIYIGGPFVSLLLYISFLYLRMDVLWINSAFYVLILNLLPILPLDGAKIIMTLFQSFLPYRWVLRIMIGLSFVTSLSLIVYFVDYYQYVFVLLFFVMINCRNAYQIPYDYYHFLFYKYLHPNPKLTEKMMMKDHDLYSVFYKGRNHLFFIHHQFIPEKEILHSLLYKNKD